MKTTTSQSIIVRSKGFLNPLLPLLDGWRRAFLPRLLRSIVCSQGLVVTELVRRFTFRQVDFEAGYKSFSRNLNSDVWDEQERAVEAAVQAHFGRGMSRLEPIAVDDGDLAKPYARRMEALGRIRDGDKNLITNGYWTFESFLVGHPYAPIPLVNFVYSLEQDGTHSQQQARRRGYEAIALAAGTNVVLVEDRGFDSLENYRDLQELQLPFLVRLTGARELLDVTGASLGIVSEFVPTWRLDHVMSAPGKWKDGIELPKRVAYDYLEVKLPQLQGRFWLIAVRRCMDPAQGGMYLLTSVPILKPADAERMIRYYHNRWRAEDSIRFLKTGLGLEGVRTLNFRPLRRLVMVCYWIMAIVSFLRIELSDDQLRRLRKMVPYFDRQRARLLHYRILAALNDVFGKSGAT